MSGPIDSDPVSCDPGIVFRGLNCAVLANQGGGGWRVWGEPPPWFVGIFGEEEAPSLEETSPFLADFLGREMDERTRRSGIWEESDTEGRSAWLEATRIRENGMCLLVVEDVEDEHDRIRRVQQHSHEQSLARERGLRELEAKRILLDCIMHDLANPASTILMNLQHALRQLERGAGIEALRHPLERSLGQVERQRDLIREIGEVFSADLNPAVAGTDGEKWIDLAETVREAVAGWQTRAEEKGVRLAGPADEGDSLNVAGHPLYLARVMDNLLGNAIRHTPAGGEVSVAAGRSGTRGWVSVIDGGPGLDLDPGQLFRPFIQGSHPGSSGLGLYFCRMTVEMWGGKIGARDHADGGAEFWFEVPLS